MTALNPNIRIRKKLRSKYYWLSVSCGDSSFRNLKHKWALCMLHNVQSRAASSTSNCKELDLFVELEFELDLETQNFVEIEL